MKLINIYINAIKLPNKKARIFLNKTDLTETLLYLFTWVIFINLPGFIELIMNGRGEDRLFLIQFIILSPFFAAFALLTGISFITLLLMLLASALKRKLKYQYLWKMAAFSLPVPILAAYAADTLFQSEGLTAAVFIVIFGAIHLKMMLDFPKRKLI
ncbi:MAG: hypothetical protein ACQEUT_11470 [Bacillota bacterium]